MRYTSTGYKIFQFFNALFLMLFMTITLFPYLNVMVKAFNEGVDTTRGGLFLWPRVPTLENFQLLLQNREMLDAAYISIFRVIVGTVLTLAVQFMAAYALSRKNFPGKNAILIFLTIPMFLHGGIIPNYILFSRVGLLNNFLVYILPGLFSFYEMIIIRTYISSTISVSLEESAKIDGANEFRVLLQIILPLCKPILATIGLWVAVAQWNDWTATLYYVTKPKLFTLQYKLMQILKEAERLAKLMAEAENVSEIPKATPDALVAAQVIITTLPIVLVYPFVQKYFVQGIMIGAVKE